MRARWIPATLMTGLLLGAALASDETPPIEPAGGEIPFAERLWRYLQASDYREKFSAWPGQEQNEYYEGRSPHGAHLKLFVNDVVVKSPRTFADRAIIVKENFTPEKELAAITVMYRVQGFDAEHDDWFWAKFAPDGQIAYLNNEPLVGRVQGCIDCHANAKNDDFVFANDPPRE